MLIGYRNFHLLITGIIIQFIIQQKQTPIQASKKAIEKLVYNNLKVDREIQTPKYKLGHLVRTADINQVFSKGDSTIYSYKVYTITEVIHDTIPSYRIDHLPE